MSTINKRIKQLRKEKDITQEQFGKIFGIVKSTVSLYESGKSTPDDDMKRKIAKYFDVSLDYLMGNSDIRNPYKDNEGDFTEEELKILEQIKTDPEISILFHDLKSAPKKKIKQLIETWEFINKTFDDMEDEE